VSLPGPLRPGRMLAVARPALLLPLLLAAACAVRIPAGAEQRSELVKVGDARVRIVYLAGDEVAARQVTAGVRAAVPRTARWGGLEAPITITIHPTHEALEQAVHRTGFAWLRAWARWDTIDLQSPPTWRLFGASDEAVAELLAHELTHCAMYQHAAADQWSWSYKGIPLWFREGMASLTAEQGYRRGGPEDLWRFYEQGIAGAGGGDSGPGSRARLAEGRGNEGDPLADPEPLYQERSEVVYGAAHHAFVFLLQRYGEARVIRLLERMRAGATFTVAFQDVMGLTETEYLDDFRRYLVLQGWRR
jgi:hypothetical protein